MFLSTASILHSTIYLPGVNNNKGEILHLDPLDYHILFSGASGGWVMQLASDPNDERIFILRKIDKWNVERQTDRQTMMKHCSRMSFANLLLLIIRPCELLPHLGATFPLFATLHNPLEFWQLI